MTLAAGGLIWCRAFHWGSSSRHERGATGDYSPNTSQSHLHLPAHRLHNLYNHSTLVLCAFRIFSIKAVMPFSTFLTLCMKINLLPHHDFPFLFSRVYEDTGWEERESLTSINKHSGTLIRSAPCNSVSPSFISEDERIQYLCVTEQRWRWGGRCWDRSMELR